MHDRNGFQSPRAGSGDIVGVALVCPEARVLLGARPAAAIDWIGDS